MKSGVQNGEGGWVAMERFGGEMSGKSTLKCAQKMCLNVGTNLVGNSSGFAADGCDPSGSRQRQKNRPQTDIKPSPF